MSKRILIILFALLAGQARGQVKYMSSTYADQAGESVVSHSGKFLLLSTNHDIITFAVNSAKGGITQKSILHSPTNEEFSGLFLSPDDKFLYSRSSMLKANKRIATIVVYSCNPQTGELKHKQTIEQQNNETFELTAQLQLSPQGNFLFLTNNSQQDLFTYRCNADGSLSFLKKSTTSTISMFFNYAMSPDEKFMYVDCSNRYTDVLVYSFDTSTGDLSEVEEIANQHTNDYPNKCIVSADGKNVYVSGKRMNPVTRVWSVDINQYSRDAQTGKLTFQKNYPNLVSEGVSEIDFMYGDGSGEYIFILKSFGTDQHAMHVFKRDVGSGNLSREKSFYDSGTTDKLKGAYYISFSPDNKHVYLSAVRDNYLNIFENPNAKASVNTPSINVSTPTGQEGGADSGGGSTDNGSTTTVTSGNATGTTTSLPKDKFMEAWKKIAAETSDTKRLDVCYELLEGKAISTVQIAAIAMLFTSEYKRLEFVKFDSYFVSDKANYSLLRDLFTYDSIIQDFNKLLQ